MYKLIIVDDEYTIRKGLQQYIPWADVGFEVLGTFEEGLSALNFLRENPVDVVFTDIDMPIMNGISLVENVKKHSLASHCVVISGYQEFEYARKLLSLRVNEYLLKPIENHEIIKTFSNIKSLIDQEREAKKTIENDTKNLRRMRNTLRRQFFEELFLQKTSMSLVQKQIERFDFGFDEAHSIIFLSQVNIDNLQRLLDGEWHYGIDALYDSITNFLKSFDTDFIVVDFRKTRSMICFVGVFHDDKPIEELLDVYKAFIEKVVAGLREISKIELSAVSIAAYRNIAAICEDRADIEELNTSFSDQKIASAHVESSMAEQLTYVYNAVNSAFVARDINDVNERLDLLYDKIKQYYLGDAREVYLTLMKILTRQLQEREQLFSGYESELYGYGNIYDMNVYTKKFIEHLKQKVPSGNDTQLKMLIDQAKEYISNNYQKNISRNDVADYMFLSASYFSRCFKQQTGMKFIDYLTNLRIQRSCELLLDNNNKISDVCEAVGYNSPSYFTRVFKNEVGLTPHEYIRANIS